MVSNLEFVKEKTCEALEQDVETRPPLPEEAVMVLKVESATVRVTEFCVL